MKTLNKHLLALAVAAILPVAAQADVTVGIITGATGPGASLGIPYKNTFGVVPATLGGEPVRYIIVDDATDTTTAVKLARKLIEQDKVDLIIGSSSVPTAIAVAEIAAELKTPQISLSPTPITPEKNPWSFSVPQPINIMMGAVVDNMKKHGVKTVAFLGFSDSWGELVLSGLKHNIEPTDIKLVASERYGRLDTSVSGQVLKLIAAKPDAVVLGGSGTPGALPQVALRERGYKGPIYHNHGVINKDFLRVGGKALEGAYAPTGPVMVAEQLPDTNPIKKVALEFTKAYEGKYGEGSRNAFAAYSWDAYLLADQAVANADKKAKPGTPAYRAALREALENGKDVVGTHGVYNMSKTDHTGVDQRASVLVEVENGKWKVVQ
ncbi:ABC transporter substrate-binding protein [Eoetvoesiella caeni]|uniref:Amino acid/amide ABC transporter substrate-binding protein (HAAT family) n=1 Tax=Eoetvoesiella caeni TaxID=645616 RepID=A0A366HG99_9BURK|nr:ABC transporter substrate-binding protein [Eoetvoesiella caeni]MCI2807714.1 ABC transporter substrate-binding protein [Eoetvoesiella caeni]NYT54279.1 ABC transporter substrate-binding protein [Eoetvoesiella caeni]RBP41629.1 amino acid/amide ABC transporter substrate-binding protein (HAAT family) [Eoetvoesiella caeni]